MIRTLTIAVSLFALSACASEAPNRRPRAPTQPQVVEHVPATSGRTAATGELREALLSLRRVHFPLDGYQLDAESRAALDAAAAGLRNHPDVAVYVQGNADERGATEYNLGLGERRARAVTSHLTRLGVDASQLSIVSFGEERPLDAGHGAQAWATNRRVDFVLLRGTVQLVVEEGTRVTDRGARMQ